MRQQPLHNLPGLAVLAGGLMLLAVIPVLADVGPDAGEQTPTVEAIAAEAPAAETTEATDAAPSSEAKPTDDATAPEEGAQEPPKPKPYPNLAKELRKIPGVLRAEFANTPKGKNCVFAWFEDKEAAKRWYFSETHQDLLDQFFPGRIEREPLFLIPDDIGPMMGLACITRSKDGPGIEQISVELYKPLHGGFSAGGRFSPDEWKDIYEHYDQYEHTEEYRQRLRDQIKARESGAPITATPMDIVLTDSSEATEGKSSEGEATEGDDAGDEASEDEGGHDHGDGSHHH